MIRAAGILFLDPKGNVLFLKRGPGGDMPGAWCLPGGKCEGDETVEQCAVREANEECGSIPSGERSLWTRRVRIDQVLMPGIPGLPAAPPEEVDFTTFKQDVTEQFTPTVDGEHVGYSWAPADQPPEPLHPGCRIALAKLAMDEVGIAQAIIAGDLTSPQRCGNFDLFALRISGTGVAYRSEKKDDDGKVVQKEEFVYRRPENYLTPEFMARCNGMAVIMMHPETIVLDTDEFRKRIVGTVLLPYIDGDEVWGIAKIFDTDASALMRDRQLSTSPGILLGRDNFTATLKDGKQLLIEGKPQVVDHIAICPYGVWDKGGPAEGIISHEARKDSAMATKEEEEAARRAADEATRTKHDAETDDKLNKLMGGIDAIATMCKDMSSKHDALAGRMDAMETARKDDDGARRKADEDAKKDSDESVAKYSGRKDDDDDASYTKRHDAEEETEAKEREAKGEPKEVAADKAKRHRKDAEEKDKERMDAKKKHDSAIDSAVAARIASVESELGPIRAALKSRPDEERNQIAGVFAATDRIMVALGDSASHALPGEDVVGYRRRLLLPLKPYSPQWKDIDLSKLDDATLAVAEGQIRHDAMGAANSPVTAGATGLRMRSEKTPSGHIINTFVGRPSAWMDPLAGPQRGYVKSWKASHGRAN